MTNVTSQYQTDVVHQENYRDICIALSFSNQTCLVVLSWKPTSALTR